MNKPTYKEIEKRLKDLQQLEGEHKQIKEDLCKSEKKYKTLTENINVGIFRSTPGAKGKFIEVNPAMVTMLGYESEVELYDLDVAQTYLNPNNRIKFSEKITSKGFVVNEEITLLKKDGDTVVVSETAIAVKDGNGKIEYFHGIIEDVTDRKKAEQELHVQKTYFEKLFNNAPEAIVLQDNNDKIISVNDEFTRMFGYTREEAIGQPINELVASKEFEEEAAKFSNMVIHGQRVEADSKRRRKDGSLIDVWILGAPIVHDGEQIAIYVIYRDITARKKAEEEVLIQKTFLEKLFNSAAEGIVLHDNNDVIVNVNTEFTKMFGYTREEAKGKQINQLVAPKQFHKDASRYSRQLVRGERVEFDSKRQRKDGTLFDASILGAPIIHDGRQRGAYAIYRDITDRKKAEEEILLQKTYLEKLFNNAPEAILLQDNEDKIINVNEEFTRLFGYSRKEAIGKPINELVASEEYQKEAAKLSDMVIHGKKVEVDSKRKRKDGSLMDVSILGAPIVHYGKQIAIYVIYRDITARKQAEENLLIQKTYLEKLFNSAPEAIVLHDNDDFVIDINDEFTKLFGYTREEAIGKPINSLVASEEFQEDAAANSYKVVHGERVEVDSVRKRKDGSLFDVWILGAPVFYDGKQMGVYAIYRDITERKKAEETRIRLMEENRMARDIQMNLLPKSNPQIPGYDIAGKSIPALNVGGDYYDFIQLDDFRLAIGLGDVSGKGLPASLVVTNLQATVHSQTFFDTKSEVCLDRANQLLYRSTDSRTFVSFFYGILDTRENTFCYANAGHDIPLLYPAGKEPIPLKTRGIALGLQENVSYEEDKTSINPGDLLLIYSDGISEAMNEKLEEFGEKRLLEIVRCSSSDSATQIIDNVFTATNLHFDGAKQNDDMTIIILKRDM